MEWPRDLHVVTSQPSTHPKQHEDPSHSFLNAYKTEHRSGAPQRPGNGSPTWKPQDRKFRKFRKSQDRKFVKALRDRTKCPLLLGQDVGLHLLEYIHDTGGVGGRHGGCQRVLLVVLLCNLCNVVDLLELVLLGCQRVLLVLLLSSLGTVVGLLKLLLLGCRPVLLGLFLGSLCGFPVVLESAEVHVDPGLRVLVERRNRRWQGNTEAVIVIVAIGVVHAEKLHTPDPQVSTMPGRGISRAETEKITSRNNRNMCRQVPRRCGRSR